MRIAHAAVALLRCAAAVLIAGEGVHLFLTVKISSTSLMTPPLPNTFIKLLERLQAKIRIRAMSSSKT